MKLSCNYIAFETITRKEIIRFLRIWPQTLLPSAITIALYFVIFGRFIGSQISDMQGFPYITFIVPGLIMTAVITNSFSNVVSSFFGNKFQKSIEELLVSPVSNSTIILGHITGGIARGILVGFVVLLISLFFTKLVLFNIWLIIIFIVLTSTLFSLGGLLNGIFAKKFDDVSIIPIFILTPLTYLGGVFYSIDLLPGIWQVISKFNPILYMINGFRYGFLGVSDVNVWFSLFMIIFFIIILYFWSSYLLKKGTGLKD